MTTIITRAGKGAPLSWAEVDDNFTNLNTDKAETTDVALKASIASPTFTGVPAAPTASVGTNTTQLATTAFVNIEITADRPYSDTNPIMDSTAAQGISPNVSRQDHVHPSDTTKASLSGATFTGGVSATTGLTVKAAATGSDDGNVVSGTWSPSFDTFVNITSVSIGTTAPWNYLRVGNVVHFSGACIVAVITASTNTSFKLSLPVGTLNGAYTCAGAGLSLYGSSHVPVGVLGSFSTDQIAVNYYPAFNNNHTVLVTGSYLIG